MSYLTPYLAIDPGQEPFDLGLNEHGRIQLAFNVVARKRASSTFLKELIAILVAAGVGVENETIFASSKAVIPDKPEPVLSIRATGGLAPLGTLDNPGAYRRPGAQIIVRAEDTEAAEAMAQAAFSALMAARNLTV